MNVISDVHSQYLNLWLAAIACFHTICCLLEDCGSVGFAIPFQTVVGYSWILPLWVLFSRLNSVLSIFFYSPCAPGSGLSWCTPPNLPQLLGGAFCITIHFAGEDIGQYQPHYQTFEHSAGCCLDLETLITVFWAWWSRQSTVHLGVHLSSLFFFSFQTGRIQTCMHHSVPMSPALSPQKGIRLSKQRIIKHWRVLLSSHWK